MRKFPESGAYQEPPAHRTAVLSENLHARIRMLTDTKPIPETPCRPVEVMARIAWTKSPSLASSLPLSIPLGETSFLRAAKWLSLPALSAFCVFRYYPKDAYSYHYNSDQQLDIASNPIAACATTQTANIYHA